MSKIAVSQIAPNDEQVRKSWNEEGITELANSIKSEGLIVPIKVRPTSNDHYEIVYGHRRYAAALLAGLDTIEALVEDTDDDQQLVSSMIENMVMEDMNDADVSDGLRQIKEETGKTNAEIGALFGKSLSWADGYLALTEEEKRIIRNPILMGLTVPKVQQVRAGIKDEKYQLLVMEKVSREGLSARQARIVAENVAVALRDYGQKGAMAELSRDYFTMNVRPLPEREDDIRGEFSWFKDKEVSMAMYVFQNFNNTISRLMATDTDKKVARKILTTMRANLSTWLARIPVD